MLRRAILGLEEPPLGFYPVQLTQLSTKGVMHNHTPIPDLKYAPNLDDPKAPPYELPTFRFYSTWTGLSPMRIAPCRPHMM